MYSMCEIYFNLFKMSGIEVWILGETVPRRYRGDIIRIHVLSIGRNKYVSDVVILLHYVA